MNFQLLPAEGNFQVQVTIHSFSNPHGMCADDACEMITGCCEGSCPDSCEYYFSLCLRPAGTPVSNVTNENQGGPECSAIRTGSETVMDGASFDESVFNTTNPITFNITEWVSIPKTSYSKCNRGNSIFVICNHNPTYAWFS